MKCVIPEISWHNRDPVLSVDIQPKPLENDDKIRLASGGYDSHVLVCIKYKTTFLFQRWNFLFVAVISFSLICKIICEY